MTKKSFGDIIREIRKNKKMTLKELSRISGVSYCQLFNIETGKCLPTPVTVSKVSRALDCDYFELFDYLQNN